MLLVSFFILTLITVEVDSLPCLSNKVKQEFKNAREKLKSLQTDLEKKIRGLDNDLQSMAKELDRKQWKKYKGHCYFFGDEKISWFDAEFKFKQLGGNLVKIDDSPENSWLMTQFKKGVPYWIGLTDLKEGEFRWSYDQQVASYTKFHSKEPDNYKGNQDCAGHHYHADTWFDAACTTRYIYVCENDFCY